MASTTTPLPEWLVIVPDHADALEKRMKSRPQHIEDLKADREDMLLWGGMFFPSLCSLSSHHLFLPLYIYTPISIPLALSTSTMTRLVLIFVM
jgi:hypothetical protein